MSVVGLIVASTLVGVGGLAVMASGWTQPRPPLTRMVDHLRRRSDPVVDSDAGTLVKTLAALALGVVGRLPRLMPTRPQLRLLGRSPEQHALWLASLTVGGFAAPLALVAMAQRAGLIGLGLFVPAVVAMLGAITAPAVFHTAAVERAEQVAADLRHQVSAYLDVVTMLLAGNTGYEGALEQAAHAGDGRLFAELRRRMREATARGASLTEALARTGRDLGLGELEQIAATAALSAAEGSPVARTLAAKCATLRSTLATEQETEARLRTSRLTSPIVGMALIFMALVIYPALSIT